MKLNGLYFIWAFFLSLSLAAAEDEILLASSGSEIVQLLELYSSESCSSCPPADRWISELKDDVGLWKQFVPVVFHVDYWNHLGWKDVYSSGLMTKRQKDYSEIWNSSNIYTPEIIVAGKEWKNWRDSKQRLLSKTPSNQKISLLLYRTSKDHYRIETTGLKVDEKYVIRIAELELNMKSKITGGENSGQILEHNFIVKNWDSHPVDSKKSTAQFEIKNSNGKQSQKAIATWLEREGSPVPIQATGGYLK